VVLGASGCRVCVGDGDGVVCVGGCGVCVGGKAGSLLGCAEGAGVGACCCWMVSLLDCTEARGVSNVGIEERCEVRGESVWMEFDIPPSNPWVGPLWEVVCWEVAVILSFCGVTREAKGRR
jgi:hypothetical protein